MQVEVQEFLHLIKFYAEVLQPTSLHPAALSTSSYALPSTVRAAVLRRPCPKPPASRLRFPWLCQRTRRLTSVFEMQTRTDYARHSPVTARPLPARFAPAAPRRPRQHGLLWPPQPPPREEGRQAQSTRRTRVRYASLAGGGHGRPHWSPSCRAGPDRGAVRQGKSSPSQ